MKKFLTILFGTTLIISSGHKNATINSNQNVMIDKKIDASKQKEDLAITLNVLNKTEINISLTNASKQFIRLYSHVEAEEKNYDYFEIEAITPNKEEINFSLSDSREKSAPVVVELKAGESFSHTISLVKWAEQNTNKETLKRVGIDLLPNGTKIRTKYSNSPCENCDEYYKSIWTGTIYSDWVTF